MKYLVGIATHTGENIDIHFGHCKEFQIIEVTDNESYEPVDVIDAGRAYIAQNERYMHGNFLFVCVFSICYHI